jgi:hypothetical protein
VGIIDPTPMMSKKSSSPAPLNSTGPRTSEVLHPEADPTTTTETTSLNPPQNPVPNTFDGEFRITNKEYNDTLQDKSSPEYQQLAAKLAKALQELLPGAKVNVKEFRSGSVIVNFRFVNISKIILATTLVFESQYCLETCLCTKATYCILKSVQF